MPWMSRLNSLNSCFGRSAVCAIKEFIDLLGGAADEELRVGRGGDLLAREAERRVRGDPVEEVVAAAVETTSSIDLDVLAVADDRKLAVLVSDILEQAVSRGANRIHLLPYKDDFFLVYRIKGRLEKVASALEPEFAVAVIAGFGAASFARMRYPSRSTICPPMKPTLIFPK